MLHWIVSSLDGWLGVTGLIVIGCAAVAYFFPPLRRIALEIAIGALTATAIYTKGNRDEARKWNNAIDKDVAKGQQARADAERGVADGSVRGDEWDRDKSGL